MSDASKSIAARAELLRAAGLFDSDSVPSPCISVCRMDEASGLCAGCFRTIDEIVAWSKLDSAGRCAVWALVEQRAQEAA